MCSRIIISCLLILLVAISCHAFIPCSKRKASLLNTQLWYTNTATTDDNTRKVQTKPNWVPMELVELVATEELQISPEEFIQNYADIEAYTSCDDEGDDFHECDFFKHYLGPTKWLHLTPRAHQSIDAMHFDIWKDVWSHTQNAVDLADKVSKDCLRYVYGMKFFV